MTKTGSGCPVIEDSCAASKVLKKGMDHLPGRLATETRAELADDR